MPAVALSDRQRGPRRGGRPHALLSALVQAGRGLRTADLLTGETHREVSHLLTKLRDEGYTRLDMEGLWHPTAAGTVAILGPERKPLAALHIPDVVAARRPVPIAPRRELPLVLRPGANDYRQHPSRRGSTLVWDHLDGRKEQLA